MKQLTLRQIADLVDGELKGCGESMVVNADIIRDVKVGYLTFAEKPEYFSQVAESDAIAVILPKQHYEAFQEVCDKDCILVANAAEAFEQVVTLFRRPPAEAEPFVSEAASIHPTASIGENVLIEAGVRIGAYATVGDGVQLHQGVQLMSGVSIGANSRIFPGVVLYENTQIGERCILHANCVIGCYGFGYQSSAAGHTLSAQLGNVEIEDDVEVGAGATIDRGTFGSTLIGEGTKIDNQVQIGHNCRIGKRNLICALVGIAGSCSTGDDVVMAGQVGIGDHIHIGNQVILGAKAGVMADIPDKQVYVGIPATPAKQQMTIVAATHRLPELRKKINKMERMLNQLNEMVSQEEAVDAGDDSNADKLHEPAVEVEKQQNVA